MGDVRATDMWNAVRGDLQLQVTRPIYETWLKGTEGLVLTHDRLTVEVPTPFGVEWLEKRMYQLVQKTAEKVVRRPLEVQFQVRGISSQDGGGEGYSEDEVRPQRSSSLAPPLRLNKKYTFGNFIVGPSNRLPYSAAQAVAEAPGQSYNPLFIYSGVGLGKTHLLNAIGHSYASRGLSFIYVTSEQFTNEFIASIRRRTTEEFRSKYRNVEVLLIDDIQFIAGKEQTQEGFFHTLNDLHSSNRQVVLTSDRPPRELSQLADRLRSRFEWGLIADVQPPDLETRMAILRSKMEQMDVALDQAIIEYVATKVNRNVRELEGSLNRLEALVQLTGRPLNLELAAQAIADFVQDTGHRTLDTEAILGEVGRRFRVSNEDLVGPSRKKHTSALAISRCTCCTWS